MYRKTLLALAVASAFGLTSIASYAQEDKKDEKSPFPADLIAQEDKKDEKSPFPADLIA